jgi:DNA-binding MarR family transcriptional regulator
VFAQPNQEEATPAEFAQQVVRLQKNFEVPVVLLLRRIEFYQRNRLVQMGVPFVVPRRQLFIPQLMIDLRDHFPRAASKVTKYISAPAQLVVLYHLLVKDVGSFSLRELARRTGYSAMTLTKVQDELKGCGLCEVEQVGRRKNLRFKSKGKKLWKNALPLLRSPVRSVKPLRECSAKLMKAGISALSEYTHINPDRMPVYAIKENVFKKVLMNGEAVVAPSRDEAVVMVELWSYDPEVANLVDTVPCPHGGELERNQFVDKLSLFLSLRDNPDERVQGELKELMESVSW